MTTDKGKKSKPNISKERLIYVYLPSHGMLQHWKETANNNNMSISKFVIEHVNNSIQQEEGKDAYTTRAELSEDIQRIKEENIGLYKRLKEKDNLIDRLEEELREYRIKPFLDDNFSGIRKFERDLIQLFKTRSEVRKETILGQLGINPMDTDIIKGIKKQIETLEQYGLLKDIGGKWRWKG
ncbi:MAG: hypothetical protein JXA91_08650 [Candidatus Thermoplasmatota archaeon]|nr:hypothetical protein [Candidatus Thermoplasmatota archaeon]